MITSKLHRSLLICALLTGITLAAYWPVLNNGFIYLDDSAYITSNPNVESGLTWENVKWSFQAGYSGNWHPLTWMSHMLDVQMFGLNPRWHHLVNLLLHLINTLLLFQLFQGLTGMAWRSALVAALFAVHPLHVESVAWAAERKDVLSAFFFLLTLSAYVCYARGVSRITFHASRFYWLALLFFALGLMSKPMLVTLPFVLLLLDVWPLGRLKTDGWRVTRFGMSVPEFSRPDFFLLLEKLPFLLLSLASCWVSFVAQARGQTIATLEDLPLYSRAANAAVSYLRYLGQTFWPVNLAYMYPFPSGSDFWSDWQVGGAVLILVAISFFTMARIKCSPWLATGWFWFLGTLVPVIGFVQVGGQAMADRYTYIPLIGIFLCLVWGMAGLFAGRGQDERIPAIIGAVVVLVCAGLARQQVRYWRDNYTIASHALAVTGNNALAQEALGRLFNDQGKYDLAVEHLRAAVAANSRYSLARDDLAIALNNSGLELVERGRFAEAAKEYVEALLLQPDNLIIHLNLAAALVGEGDLPAAEAQYAESLRLDPNALRALIGFGRVLAGQGKLAEAEVKFREAVRLYPANVEALLDLGMNLRLSGQTNEAAKLFSAAMRLQPDLAEENLRLSRTLEQNGQVAAAFRDLLVVSWLKPDDAPAHKNLGAFLLRHRQPADAVGEFEEALRLQPNADSHSSLGLALATLGRIGEAVNQYETAIKMNPDWPGALNNLAWLLATHPDANYRNGPEAVRLAKHACELTAYQQTVFVGTLAAACAEAGQFDEAIAAAQKACALASEHKEPDLLRKNQELLALYQAHQPYRELTNR